MSRGIDWEFYQLDKTVPKEGESTVPGDKFNRGTTRCPRCDGGVSFVTLDGYTAVCGNGHAWEPVGPRPAVRNKKKGFQGKVDPEPQGHDAVDMLAMPIGYKLVTAQNFYETLEDIKREENG